MRTVEPVNGMPGKAWKLLNGVRVGMAHNRAQARAWLNGKSGDALRVGPL